jgi:hypothetical protein
MVSLKKGSSTKKQKETGIVLSQKSDAESQKDDLFLASDDELIDTILKKKREKKDNPVSEFFLPGSNSEEETPK